MLACIGLFPTVHAVVPPPDGGYPGGNTAEGQKALLSLTSGGFNTAVGYLSLRSNTTNSFNTAVGAGALFANLGLSGGEGTENTATGAGALLSNTSGGRNTANGGFALFSNTGGSDNTAIARAALFSNSTGSSNTAIGFAALQDNTTGGNNTALGYSAGINLTTGDNNIDIGSLVQGVAGESNTIRIGNTDITTTIIRGISGQTIPSGATVLVAANGQLGTMTSSKRFKEEIKPMAQTSEAILALKPVTFRYKKRIDPKGTSQFGLVAEDVEKVNPDLVVRDEKGKPYSVRYDQVNAMLLNEFLKEHQKVQELTSTVQKEEEIIAQEEKRFESKLAEQGKQIEALTSGLESVSARLEVSEARSRTVLNNSQSDW
jgi:hypothetical protein